MRRSLLAVVLLCTGAAELRAEDNDLVMARLARVSTDPMGDPAAAIGQNRDFRAMSSELGVVLAPRLLSPSDTLGFGGFQFSADVGVTDVHTDKAYWRVLEGSPDPSGAGDHGDGAMATTGLFVRKGMWFPVPSSEVGAGFVHVMDSNLYAAQAYAKIGLHEGYHDLPVPSVAVRGGVSRLMGSRDLDLTVASFDASISKMFGVGGTWSLSPYAGWNLLVIVPRSEVLDATPRIDPLDDGNEDDHDLNFVFKDQDDILRQRFFVGAKLQYYVFALVLEANIARRGSSVDDRATTDMECASDSTTTTCDSTDRAGHQRTYSVSLALDF